MIAEQALLGNGGGFEAVNSFVNLPPNRRQHDCTDQQCLQDCAKWGVKFHSYLDHSEKVFLNFQTLGAATAMQ